MVENHVLFDQRLRRLGRKHRAMARGYTTRMRSDGLIVVKPKRAPSPISRRSLFLFFAAFFLFKGFLLASLGSDTFDERVERLASGTMAEQAGGWVMQADPVTQFIARQIGPLLR